MALKSYKLSSPAPAKFWGFTGAAILSAYLVWKKIKNVQHKRAELLGRKRIQRLIVITGCDSGLGYSMAVWGAKLGYKVLAGCLNENGEGARKLREEFPDKVIVTRLNVTEGDSLGSFHERCREILDGNDENLELWALIANAAVCTMGEFFWQTQAQKRNQMEVNFWGTVNFVSEFRELLFESRSRVIVISSDCSEYPLPYLSTYCASKAALNSWTQAFRFEMAKYGVSVAAYQPRDFAQRSGLFSNLELQYNQMTLGMTDQDKAFYGEYFDKFMKKKQEVFCSSKQRPVKVLNSSSHRNSFVFLLETENLNGISVYRDFSCMEKVFHALYKYLPQGCLDKLANFLLNPDCKTIYWRKNEKEH